MRTRSALIAALSGVVLAAAATPASATDLPSRTRVVSTALDGGIANGSSARPVLSANGTVLAFDSTAGNLAAGDLNGAIRDVYAIDQLSNERRLVSVGPGPTGGDGPSYGAAVNSTGSRVVFASDATNLVPGDTNGVTDLFARDGLGPLVRISTTPAGTQANGPSYDADMSSDGRYVVFTSDASNLVAGDTNGRPDIFLRDLSSNTISRLSVSEDGSQGSGRSVSAAISADGSAVSFASDSSTLVPKDTNGVMDVFVRDLDEATIERASVSTKGVQQNKAAAAPFSQISDLSADGRYVVFDSDGTNVYSPDTNNHTDVFMRDRSLNTTILVSASSINVQGNNDSFAPRLTDNGRYLSFESFATNLAAGDGPREDIFLRDLKQGTTSVVNVTADGSARGPEQVTQLLQRPAVSNDGQFAAFSSTVTNLVPGDTNASEDVFVRLLDAPVGRVVSKPKRDKSGTVVLAADDPLATSWLCQVDAQSPYVCSDHVKIKKGVGRVLRVRAGGPGMLFDPDPVSVVLTNDRSGPTVRISALPGSNFSVIRGRASDKSGVAKVEVGLVYYEGTKGCRYLASRKAFSKKASLVGCLTVVLLKASGTKTWRFKLPRKVRGPVAVYARGYDKFGNVGKVAVRQGIVR